MTDQMPKPTGLSKPTVGNDDFFNQDFSKFGQPAKNLEVGGGDLAVGLAGSAARGFGTGIAEIGLSDLVRAGSALSDKLPGTQVLEYARRKLTGESEEEQAAKKADALDQITGVVTDPIDNAIIKPIVNPIGTAIKEGGETLIDRGTSDDYKEALRGRELFTGSGVSDFAISDSAGDPAVWAAKFTDGIGSLGGTLAVGALTGGTVKALVKKQMLKRGASMELADETARLAGIKWGQRGAMAEGVNMSTGQSADQARSQVDALSWDQLLTSKTFNDQVKEISSDPQFEGASATDLLNEAKRRTADYAASIAKSDPKTWAAAAAGTLLGDAALFKMLQGTGAKGVAVGALQGMGGEGFGEAVEEGTQQYVGNEATNIAGGQNIDPMSGVVQAAATAGTIGALSGGGVGAIGGARGAYAPQDEQASIAGEQPSDPQGSLQASAVPEFDSALAEVNAIERKAYGQHSIGRDGNKFRGAYVDELGNVQTTPAYSKIEDVRAAMGWPVNGPSGDAAANAAQSSGSDDFANVPAFQRQDGGRFKGWAEDSDVQRALAGEFGPSVQEIIAAQMQSGDQGKTLQERVVAGELGQDPFAGGKGAVQVGMDNAPLALPQKDIIYAGDANAKQPGTEVSAPGAFDDKPAGPGPQFRGSERTRWQDGQEGDVLPPEAAGNPAGALPGRVIEGEAREVGTELPYKPFIAGEDNRAAVSEDQQRQAVQSAQVEQLQNQPKQIGQSGTIFAPGTPGPDNKNSAYTPPRLSRDQIDPSLGEQSTRDPRSPVAQSIEQAGSEQDTIFGQLKSLRITKRGKPFASQKEAQLASRKTETPIALPTGGFGVVDKAELEQAIAAQGDVSSPANNPIALDVGEVKRPNGQIGNQGVSESQIIPLLNNVAGLSLPESATMRQAVDALKSDKTAQAKLREFTAANPIQAWEMPDGSISIQDGHHRAFLLDQLGDKTIPANIKDYTGPSQTYQPQENAGATQPVNQAPVKQPSSNAEQLGQSAEPTATVMNEGVKQPEASQVKHDSNEAPGSDVGNGFKAGPHKGEKYRVGTTNTTGAENGTPILEKRRPSGSAATFYVGKDGNLLDAGSVVFNDQSSKERVWRPASKEQTAEAVSILDEMGKLDLYDPKRAELKVKLKALVLGETTSTIKPSMQAEASPIEQTSSEAGQLGQSAAPTAPVINEGTKPPEADNAAMPQQLPAPEAVRDETRQDSLLPDDGMAPEQNTAPAPDAGVSVSGAGKQRITIEPLTDKSIIVKGDKNDAELKGRVEAAWPKAKPLYNERHKGWVFSSKREGVVREALADLLPGDVSEQKAAPVPWSEIQDRNEGTTPDADEAVSLLAAMQYGNKTLNDYVDVKAKSAEIIQQMKGVYDLYAHMDAAMRDAGYEFGKSDRERLMGNYLDMDEMTARDISNMKTKGILSDGKTRVVDVPDGGSMFDAGKLLRNEYSKADVLAVLAKQQNEDFTPRDGWESNLQAAREYANHLRKTGQISEGAALKAWGKLESLVGLITNATAPAGKTVDFSKAKTVEAQLDMWDSLEAGDRVIDVKGIDRGSVFSKMKSRRIVQLTDQFNKRDGFSIAAITGGGSDIVAQLEARHAVNNPQQPVSTDGVMTLDQLKQLRIDTINKLAQQEADNHSTDDRLQRKKDQLDRAIAEVEAQTKADLSGSDREQKTDGVDRAEFKDVHPIINEETEALAQKLGAFLAKGDKAGAQAAFEKWLKEEGLFVKKWEMIAISDRAKTIANQINRGDKAPSKPEGKLDKAAQAIKDKKREKAEKLKRLLQERKGTLNAGIDPELMIAVAELGALSVADGAVRFAQFVRDTIASTRDVGIDDADVKPFLKEAYGAIASNPEKYGVSDEVADNMDMARDYRRLDIDSLLDGDHEQSDDATARFEQDSDAKKLRAKLRDSLYLDLYSGLEIGNNNDLKKAAAQALGIKPAEVTALQLKDAQEAYEVAAARVRREHIQKRLNAYNGQRAAFDYAVDEYGKQPNLDVRTANSSDMQAYSTPAPMALLANLGAGIHAGTTVYEPTAGNGLLLLTGDQSNTYANELDPERADALAWSGFNVTILDATNSPFEGAIPGQVDAVVANPPFGKLRDANGKPTKITFEDPQGRAHSFGELDHVIAKNALDAMKDDGKAALILGAAKEPGDYTGNNKAFLNWLYSNYNVVHHIEVDGDLYKGQGAGWPTQMIVIHGRAKQGTGKFAPFKGEIKRLDNWSDIYDSFKTLTVGAEGAIYRTREGNGRVLPAYQRTSERNGRIETGEGRSGGVDTGLAGSRANGSGRPARSPVGKSLNDGGNTDGTFGNQRDIKSSGLGSTDGRSTTKPERTGRNENDDHLGLPGQRDGHAVGHQHKPKDISTKVEKVNDFQAAYQTASNGFNDAVLTPINMASYTQKALADIQDRHGSVDGFVADRLGYDSHQALHKAFMGLQVDAVALAVDAVERGRAIIIGDQTGVGKGRQAAGVIRYAMQQGLTPIFVTQKPNLFTDMYDDLADIGVTEFKPLIMNQDKGFISKNDEKLFDLNPGLRSRLLRETSNNAALPANYHGLFLTYSQISSDQTGKKLDVLRRLAPKSLFILDESHTAAGGDSKLGIAFQTLVDEAKGVTYLSATYAKRPDNMTLYTRTDLGLAVENKATLIGTVMSGGIGMQTYIASKLSEAGQMVRRERSFDGIRITNKVLPDKTGEVTRQFDDVTEALRAIQDLSSAWKFYVDTQLAKQIQAESGMDTRVAGNKADTTVNVTLFSSVVHNYIAQLSLGLKARQTAQLAIEAIKNGQRPVIAVENTMGAALKDFRDRTGLSLGDHAEGFNYAQLLKSIADGVLSYSVKQPGATKAKTIHVPIHGVDSDTIQSLYASIMDLADNMDVAVPASPIDAIRAEITKAGYSVAEITGREEILDYRDNAKIIKRPKAEQDRRAVVDRFNRGKLDVLILNQAGSTGLSIHASDRFADQRPRHMIVAQPSLDINTFMQMLGRVNRTGQVVKPTYDLVWLDLPSEVRPAAVLSRKMASLNANTSGNTDSATNIDSADLLNPYGDKVVAEYVEANSDILYQYSPRLVNVPDDDAASYFLGKLAVTPVAVQKQVLEEIEANYRTLIEYLDATGQNELNMSELDLDAKPLEQMKVSDGRANAGVFAEPTYITKVDVKAQGKAPSWDEVKSELAKSSQADFDDAIDRMQADEKYQERLQARYDKQAEEVKKQDDPQKKHAEQLELTKRKDQMIGFTSAKNELERKFKAGGTFAHGAAVRVKLPENESPVTGIVVSLNYSHESGNPAALSKWKVGIMLADRIRLLPLSMTREEELIEGPRRDSEANLKAIFDRAAEQPSRESRFVMTGNLIEAQSRSSDKGRIVPFTTHDGRVIQGMLMPKKFKPADLQDKAAVSANQAFDWLSSTEDRTCASMGLRTADGEVLLRRNYDGGYTLELPKAVSKGKRYWGDPRMVAIIGEQAVKGAGKLAIKLDHTNARSVAGVMANINPLGIYNQAQIKDYNRKTGKAVPTFDSADIRFSLSDAAPNTRGMTKPELEMVVTDWSKQYKGAASARIMVAANQAEMNEVLGMVGAAVPDGQTVNAAYLPGYKTLLLNAEAIQSPKRARELMRHELLAHHGLREVVGDDAYISIIEAVKRGKDISGIKDAYYQVAQNYTGMHVDVQAEEVFAHWMEQQPDRGELAIWWRGIVRRVKDALRAVGLVGERTTEEEFNRVLDAIATGMRNGRKPGRRVMESWHEAPAYSKGSDDGGALFSLGANLADQSIIGKAESLAKAAPSSVLNWIKEQRGVGLGALTDLQIDQIYRGVTGGAVSRYQKLRAKMEADRNDILLDAETRIDPLWDSLGKEQKKALSNLMHDATMAKLHPDLSLADNSLYQEVKQKLDRATKPSTKAEYQAELDTIIANHKHLAERYNLGLNKEGKALYQTMRETYDKQWADLRDAIEQRLEDMMGAEGKTLAAELRLQMEHALKHGPYFPLARFGDYVVKASKGDEHIREHFERRKDAEQAIKQYQRDGYNAVMTVKEEGNGGQANSNALGLKVMQLLDEADSKGGSASSIKDDVWQAMLQMLPDASFAKHAIHRRRVKGASRDGHRAYLNSVYHYAHHVSKIRYGHKMQAELNKMNEQIQAGVRGEESNIKPEDLEVAQQVLNEMNKRHELNMNPKGAKWTGWAGNLGFMWYMAGSPASAIINMTQNFTVMLPQLGAKYGFVKASAAMAKALHDYAKHGKFKAGTKEAWKSLTRATAGISADEKAMLNALYRAGVLDLTQAHSIAARADTDLQDVKPGSSISRTAMRMAGALFHNAEVLNREVAALAAYRLLKEQSPNLTTEQYADQVTEMVYDGHGNYAASNRPRYMRGDVAKVLTQFKIYSQMMTYSIYRNAYLAAKGDKVALKTLGGVLGTHFIMAGVMGLPFPITAALYAIAAAADDDDDRTGKASFRLGLAETMGPDLGELVARGPMDAVTGLSIAGRTGINDLWFREPKEGAEGDDLAWHITQQIAGPVLGIGVQAARGLSMMSDGDYQRGAETMMPKAVKDLMKTYRQFSEGERTRKGDVIIDDVSAFNLAMQAMGFSNAEMAKVYDAREYIKGKEGRIEDERSKLMSDYFMARKDGDDEAMADVMARIREFNSSHYRTEAITSRTLRQSLKSKQRSAHRTQGGVYLSRNREYLRGEGAFIGDGGTATN